eukprot:11184462-Prorocentrum_lima.AAC.1
MDHHDHTQPALQRHMNTQYYRDLLESLHNIARALLTKTQGPGTENGFTYRARGHALTCNHGPHSNQPTWTAPQRPVST